MYDPPIHVSQICIWHRGIWLLRGLIQAGFVPGLAVWQEDVGCQWLCRAKGLWLDWSSCCMPEWWRMQVETVETWDLATLGRDVRWFPSTSQKRWNTRSASPTLQQRIVGEAATLSCTYVPTKSNKPLCCIVLLVRNPSLWRRDCTRRGDQDRRYSKKCPCQTVFKAWHLAKNLSRACKEWCCQAALRAWHLDTVSTRGCKECPCQAIFRAWHLAIVSTIACKEWRCQAVFGAWHLVNVSTRACKDCPCPAVLRAWHLETVLTRACKEWRCQAVFGAWHLDMISIRACKEWHTALLRAWHCAAAKFPLQARRGCCQSLLTNLYGSMCMRRLW